MFLSRLLALSQSLSPRRLYEARHPPIPRPRPSLDSLGSPYSAQEIATGRANRPPFDNVSSQYWKLDIGSPFGEQIDAAIPFGQDVGSPYPEVIVKGSSPHPLGSLYRTEQIIAGSRTHPLGSQYVLEKGTSASTGQVGGSSYHLVDPGNGSSHRVEGLESKSFHRLGSLKDNMPNIGSLKDNVGNLKGSLMRAFRAPLASVEDITSSLESSAWSVTSRRPSGTRNRLLEQQNENESVTAMTASRFSV